eukprot:TRINITY_DN115636_c0_g1_i1.p1 TRINITY_DN115636_c0_g1~~TRINITY_DN115636_c0_g1_i1.p1  ORF type:complete len:271 (-),score=24.99 TRINITY_DN115636_c0_g1_i1:9-728(-)
MPSVASTMDALREGGFPPVFIFMYDEIWLLCQELFGAMEAILQSKAVEMDASVFAWALQSLEAQDAIGSNFGQPHRDCSFKHAHSERGELTLLTVWVPVVPVTIDSGCMYVVPADSDPLFNKSDDPLHMQPDQAMPWAHIRPLPCSPGDILLWKGNLIHWGSACGRNVQQPRKSIGTAFIVPCDTDESLHGKGESLSKAQVEAGLSLEERLRLVLRALIKYEHWHPKFAGLSDLEESVQ